MIGSDDITVLDVTGLQCPLPVLKAQKALRALSAGAVLDVISTDPMASIDIPHFCAEKGHELLLQINEDGATRYRIKKG
ncbi:MAG: sulfurtransferase TusA family protein [Rhizobiales bacterium]|nr:sulfurtransferase TusA family protein [Hyphomicrobiales bacterium]